MLCPPQIDPPALERRDETLGIVLDRLYMDGDKKFRRRVRACQAGTFRGRLRTTIAEPHFFVGAGSLDLAAGSVNPVIFYFVSAIAAVFGASALMLVTRLRLGKANVLGAWGVLSFTFKDAIRAKWLIVFAVAFFLIATNLPGMLASYIHMLPPGYGLSTLNEEVLVAFPFVPLLALLVGATSIVDDRESGTMQYLLEPDHKA
jgi:hypothetical protein